MKVEERLKELGIELPAVGKPMGTYVHAVQTGNLLFLAGKGPQAAVDYGAAHGALAMTTPGDASMADLREIEAAIDARGAGVIR